MSDTNHPQAGDIVPPGTRAVHTPLLSDIQLTAALSSMLNLEKQRRETISELEAGLDDDAPATSALCYQFVVGLIRQQLESARDIQEILDTRACHKSASLEEKP